MLSKQFNIKISIDAAPHRSRKKRELTRAVEAFKKEYGGERVPHRLL